MHRRCTKVIKVTKITPLFQLKNDGYGIINKCHLFFKDSLYSNKRWSMWLISVLHVPYTQIWIRRSFLCNATFEQLGL